MLTNLGSQHPVTDGRHRSVIPNDTRNVNLLIEMPVVLAAIQFVFVRAGDDHATCPFGPEYIS